MKKGGNQLEKDEKRLKQKKTLVKTELLPDDHPILKAIENLYIGDWKKKHSNDKLNRDHFFVSDVGRCKRQVYGMFHHSNRKRDMAASTIMMFKHGDLFHDELQTIFARLGASENKWIEFGTLEKVGFTRTGRLDLLIFAWIFNPKEKGIIVGEIKSKNPFGYNVDEPEKDEVDQLISYISEVKQNPELLKRFGKVADYGLLIYADRAGFGRPLPIKIWKVFYSQARIEEIKADFQNLTKRIEKEDIPARPYERDSIPCQYCRLFDWCWEGVPEEPEEPERKPDETIEKPEKEIIESAESRYVELKKQAKKIDEEIDYCRGVLMQFFKSTGTKETELLKHSFSKKTVLNNEFLLSKFKDKWHLLAKADPTMIKQAIEDGEIDAEAFERAKIISYDDRILIKKLKEAKQNAD